MSFPRYPTYKDSGVEWLGEVPGHWEVVPLKFIANVQTGVAKGKDNSTKATIQVPYMRVANVQDGYLDLDNIAEIEIPAEDLPRYRLQKGDVLMNEGGDFDKLGRGHIWNGSIEPCIHQNHVFAVRPHGVSPVWLNAITGSQYAQFYFMSRSKQSTNLASISSTNLMELPVVLPPQAEQTGISVFLDRETAKIDALVAEQRRLMALLKEKRQAVISHAVTRGLNPRAPMKPSGIEWLGDVPEHWDVCSIRRVVTAIEQGWSPECFARPAEDEEWGVLKAGCVNRGIYEQNDNKALPAELTPMPEYEVQVGDVLMSRASGSPELVGSTALVTSTREKLMLSDKIFRFRFDQQMEPKFFVATLNSRPMRSQIEQALSGGNGLANNLPQASLRGFFLAVPPKQEQLAVCEYLESELAKFDTLTTEAQRAIDLLQERRTALISAAVTGQIDVREVA
ncbi:MAG: restriction endonuclease subunit S [Rhodoferax sp.]|nr:restriction endonuclease subunit S [Rhodoferax sp.]MDP3654556.1 restriction endonuclease subunit S [Rhodoferax sp.]